MTKNTIKTEDLEVSSKKAVAKKTSAKVVQPTKSSSTGKIKITLVKSLIGRLEAHKNSARGLGLSKIRQTVEVADTVENRGMINAIGFLLKCEG